MKKTNSVFVGLLILLSLPAFALAAFAGCKDAEPAATAAAQESAAESSVTANVDTAVFGGKEMDYVKFGSGEKTFVIIPGLSVHSVTASADAVAAAYADFSDEYTVYLFDRAKDIPQGYGIRDMAADTAEAMKSLGIENADVFGASQGGMITLILAADYPELVNRAVIGSSLAATNDTFNAVIDEWVSLARDKDETGLLESFADHVYSEATLDAYRGTLISSNAGITDEEYERFIILAEACRDFDCTDVLDRITCPVLVLGAQGDKVTTAEGSKQIAEALGCESFLYDDTYGHGVYDEAPDYKQRILDFFAEDAR